MAGSLDPPLGGGPGTVPVIGTPRAVGLLVFQWPERLFRMPGREGVFRPAERPALGGPEPGGSHPSGWRG